MGYSFQKTDVFHFVQSIGAKAREKGQEIFFEYCPYCKGGGHDRETFSVNVESGAFKCFRASCGRQGHFVELARDFNFKLDFGNENKQYKKFVQKEISVKPNAVAYLMSRGISAAVAERYKITCQSKNENILVFPFYDENNVLTFVKYRNTKYNGKGNKEWCEKDTKPILFGMAQCEDFSELVITEGQMDSLSLTECGIKNAVSVPTGALGFTWLAHVWDWIVRFESVVVFGDCENGKVTLADTLQKRLPQKVKVVQQEDYLGEKDANALLQKYGRQAVVTAVERAAVPPIENVKELSDVQSVDIYSLARIKTNIAEIDKLLMGFFYGQVILLTGKRGEGKSTFLSQLAVEAIEQDAPVFIYSGELPDYHFKRWLNLQIAGDKHIRIEHDEFYNEIAVVPGDVEERINSWYRGKAYIYDNNFIPDAASETETLLQTIERAIKQFGIKMVCVDNLMTAIEIDAKSDLYLAQSKFVHNLKRIAVKYDCVVLLVAHPKKEGKNSGYDANELVSGSADITNRVDVVMRYERAGDEEECDGILKITKNRLTGRLTGTQNICLWYSNSTKRITSLSSKPNREYGWNKKTAQGTELDLIPDLEELEDGI